ncbi:hypothetical protein ACHAXH_007655 [Discostella pseudostelligera]
MSDDATSSIPVMRKPVDLLSNGLNSNNLASAAVQRHPIDRMQRASTGQSPLDLDAIRRLYGSGLAMRLATERQMALQVGGRLPGLDAHPDSRAMYETLTGDDVTLDFGDYLNLSKNRPEVSLNGVGVSAALGGEEVPHAAMESRLGL